MNKPTDREKLWDQLVEFKSMCDNRRCNACHDYADLYAIADFILAREQRLREALALAVPWVAIATADPSGYRQQAAKNAEDDLKKIQAALGGL